MQRGCLLLWRPLAWLTPAGPPRRAVHSQTALRKLYPRIYNRKKREMKEKAKLPPNLTYLPTYEPEFILRNGWSPPPASKPDLPFSVERTAKANALPIYLDYKKGRTQITTSVQKVSGDHKIFMEEMSKVCGHREVRKRGGRFEAVGKHSGPVLRWLIGLGF
ncbi:unnamed protein product [Chrysoparadoxa australica]